MSNKTIEELEREAYIKGDVETAKLYADLDELMCRVGYLEELEMEGFLNE